MGITSGLTEAAALFMFLVMSPQYETLAAEEGARFRADAVPESMLTDRLNARQLKIWKSIERIALAADLYGNPVRPRLHALWLRARSSRHRIHVEINDRDDPRDCGAAEFRIENSGNGTYRGVAAIRLNLPVIHAASAKKWIDGSDRSTSLRDLGKYELYAGIFGHELLHAFMILEDPEHARLYQEYEQEAAAYYLARKNMPTTVFSTPEMQARLQRLDFLRNRIEKPVNLIEGAIWQELKAALGRKYY